MTTIIPKKILLAQTLYLGDLILALPVIQHLRLAFPYSDVDVLVEKGKEEILKNNPYVSSVLVYDKKYEHKGLKGIFSLSQLLRLKQYDVAIVMPGSIRTALAVYLAHIPRRIGSDQSTGIQLFLDQVKYPSESWRIPGGRIIRFSDYLWRIFNKKGSIASLFFTETIVLDQKRHATKRMLQLLEPLGIVPRWEGLLSQLFPSTENVNKVSEFIPDSITKSKHILAVAPGSSWDTKRWHEEGFIGVIKKIITQDISVILIGTKNDFDVCQSIEVDVQSKMLLNSCGRLTVLESSALLKQCSALLTNESGAMHIASAMGVPSIVLMGPTVKEFGFVPNTKYNKYIEVDDLACRPCTPFGGVKCPTGTFDCMKRITVEEVFDNVMSTILNKPIHKL
jgi:heptosyltransferase II